MKTSFDKKIFLLIFNCMSALACFATDLAGSQLTYMHLGGNDYRITYVLYRDCYAPLPAPATEILTVSSGTLTFPMTFTMNQIAGTGNEILYVCPSAVTTCAGGFVTSIQKWVYEVDVTLITQCPDWTFSVRHCCFSYGVTTGVNVHNNYSYAEARLDNTISNNSSPRFTNEPVILICQDQDFHFNNGLVDDEGDSLFYILTPVLQNENQSIVYQPGFSSQQPLTSSPQVTLDPITGDLFIHSTATEKGLITYTVYEFRNGALLGSSTRTVMIVTQPCTNQMPVLSGINGTNQYSKYVFPGTNVCFDIYSDDADTGQLLTLTWNNGIQAATFTTAGGSHPTGTFCWQTSLSDLRTLPYDFTARIADDNCDYNGVEINSYHVYVTLDSTQVWLDAPITNSKSFISISPNPSKGVFMLKSVTLISEIKIYNYTGICIRDNIHSSTIDLREESNGIYFIETTTADGKKSVQKIIKSTSE
jgi:hypothetical protein